MKKGPSKGTIEFVLDLVNPDSQNYRNRKSVADRLISGRKNTVFYSKRSEIKVAKTDEKVAKTDKEQKKIRVTLVNENTLDAAAQFALATKSRPLIQIMASDIKPGGGWLKDSIAQEEECFKPTSCFYNIEPVIDKAYPDQKLLNQGKKIPERTAPMSLEGAIYLPDVYWFRGNRDERYEIYKWSEHAFVDFIVIPALRHPPLDKQTLKMTDSDRKITLEKIRTVFDVAIAHGHTTLVLGAFGCGVYKNNPYEIAELYKQVIAEYSGSSITDVCFAILQTDARSINFDVFVKVFRE